MLERIWRMLELRPGWRLAVKIASLGLLLGFAPLAWTGLISLTEQLQIPLPERVRYNQLYWLYWLAFACGITAIILTPFLRSTFLRTASALLLVPGFLYERTAAAIGAVEPGSEQDIYALIAVSWNLRANATDAISAYGHASLPYIAIALLFIIASALKPERISCPNWLWILLPAAFGVAAYIAYQPYAYNRYVFPAPFNIPAYALRVVLLETHYAGERDQPSIRPIYDGTKNVVFILDESVRGDFLSLNRPTLDNTPYLASVTENSGIPYGVATSIANCSTASRLALRSGVRNAELPDTKDTSLHKPTFWQFAKAAGYETIYLEAFGLGFAFHSYMNMAERRSIDDRRSFKPSVETDNIVARALRSILDTPNKKFIFVEKLGVHFPHDGRNEPPNYEYEPRGIDTLPKVYSGAQRDVVRYYLRSLRWRVDGFFRTLGDAIKRQDTVVIYTSDHGQNMFESAELQHCGTNNASAGEASVPLVAFTGDAEIRDLMLKKNRDWKDLATHEAIFPTLIRLMGYSRPDVEALYGPSLFDDPPSGPRSFLTRDLWGKRKMLD